MSSSLILLQVTGPGGTTNYTVPISSPNYSNPFPAPGTTGSYAVTSVFTPAPGNSLSPATSPPQPLTVTPATATITEALAPNPATPGAAVAVSGTVASPNGPLAGAVQLYVSIPYRACIPSVFVRHFIYRQLSCKLGAQHGSQ